MSRLSYVQLAAFCEISSQCEYMESKTVKEAMREARVNEWTITAVRTFLGPKCEGKNPEWAPPKVRW